MATYQLKKILDIPTRKGIISPNKEIVTLEDSIVKNFTKEGLKRFNEYDLNLDVPFRKDFVLEFQVYDDLKDDIGPNQKIVGKVYQLDSTYVQSITCDGAKISLDNNNSYGTSLAMLLDLNPADEDCRYLKMLISYKSF